MNLISHGSNRPCFGDSDVRCLRLPIRICPQSRCGPIDQLADPATFLAAARLIPPLPTERSARHANQGKERPLGRSRIKPHPDDRSMFCKRHPFNLFFDSRRRLRNRVGFKTAFFLVLEDTHTSWIAGLWGCGSTKLRTAAGISTRCDYLGCTWRTSGVPEEGALCVLPGTLLCVL